MQYWASKQVFFFQTNKHGYKHTLSRLKKANKPYFTVEWVKNVYIEYGEGIALPTSINRHLNLKEFGFLLWTCLAFFIQNVLHICKHLKEELKGSKMKPKKVEGCVLFPHLSLQHKHKCYLGAKHQIVIIAFFIIPSWFFK